MYRIKHIPTGMYFIPAREVKVRGGNFFDYTKSNLSKTGKVYHRRPSMSFLGGSYYDHTKVMVNTSGRCDRTPLYPVIDAEWIIEELVIGGTHE